MGMALVRAFFAVVCAAIGFFAPPGGAVGLAAGLAFAVAVVAVEMKLHSIPANVLMGGVVGSFMGLLLAIAFGIVGRQLDLPDAAAAVIQGSAFLMLAYLGMVIGAVKGEHGEWWIPWKKWVDRRELGIADKVLDSSVLIDGRIADICESGFLGGRLIVAQFVLDELQRVADSDDATRRARGRRGLDIVRRLQQMPGLEVAIVNEDFPKLDEVDSKLIALGTQRHAQVVTNDFNLAKVAQVRGVDTLNINELANAVKPAFLPGEQMSVYVVKEGKEPGQGVGYLDDGTMVVVDAARQDRGRTVDLVVTSVLQTSAGKMIFGKRLATTGSVVDSQPASPTAVGS